MAISNIARARQLAAEIAAQANQLNVQNFRLYNATQTIGAPLAYLVGIGMVTRVADEAIHHMVTTLADVTRMVQEQQDPKLASTEVALDDFANPSEIAVGDLVRISLVELGDNATVDTAKIVEIEVAGDGQRTFWVMPNEGSSVALFPIDEHDEGWKIERVPTLEEVLEEGGQVPNVGDYVLYMGCTHQVESRYSDGTVYLIDPMSGCGATAKLGELTIVH